MTAAGGIFRPSAARSWLTWCGVSMLALCLTLLWVFGYQGTASFERSPRNEKYAVVYYANENTARALNSETYQSLLKILASSGRAVGTDLATALTRDADAFSTSVRYKAAEFLEQAHRRKFDLAIFTNELALAHRYMFFDAGTQRLENPSFILTSASTHPFLKTAPLAQSGALREALLDIVRRYPATPLRVLLIVHSHGTLDMALMPRVSIDLDHATSQEIVRALDAGPEAAPPNSARLQGTPKTEFWQVLRDIGIAYSNVSFPLVLRASCESGLGSWAEYFAIPNKVGLIAHTSMRQLDMRSQQLDLIFGNADGDLSVQDLSPAIRRAGFDIDSRASLTAWLVPLALWQVPAFLYFLPMVVLLICCGLATAHKHVYRKIIMQGGRGSAEVLNHRLG